MAGLFASMAVKWAVDKLSSMLPAPTPPPTAAATTGAMEDLRMLERTMRRIHATLDDAEQHWNIREESAKLRLVELKELAYDATDVVEEYEYEVNRHKVEEFQRLAGVQCGSGSCKRKYHEIHDEHYSEGGIVPIPSELGVRARTIIQRLSEMKDYYDRFSLSENDGERRIITDIHNARQTSSFVFAPSIIGRMHDKENVIKKLISGEGIRKGSRISVLAIVGLAGLGKTTLAQLVYNNLKDPPYFDLYVWVCVSEYFDVKNIVQKIISSLTKENSSLSELAQLCELLTAKIKGKRFLLVLDDVWNDRRDCWELLCMPLLAANHCQIIVTTRSEAVARLIQTMPCYEPSLLTPCESWSLFKEAVCGDQKIVLRPNMEDIARRIVTKCKGLPLAIKTIGSMLRYEADEEKWVDILESEIWNSERAKLEILPALELSYKFLPIYLQRCFVSLSLFPRGYLINQRDVVQLWNSLGLLEWSGSGRSHEMGCLYINELVMRSMIKKECRSRFSMHDLMHHLACLLAGEEFFRLELGNHITVEIPQKARYLSIIPSDILEFESIHISNESHSLRAIIMMGQIHANVKNPEALFSVSKQLRILHLEKSSFAKSLLGFLATMKLLRYLRLGFSEDESFRHKSMFELFNLHTLELNFDLKYTPLCGIGRLINLRTLPQVNVSGCDCFCNITELMNMDNIRELHLNGLSGISCIEDAREARLYNKKQLQILRLNFSLIMEQQCEHIHHPESIYSSHEQLLASLQPHHGSLSELSMEHCICNEFPGWLGNASFCMLTKISLLWCTFEHIPTLGELPSLKSLNILGLNYVKRIGREFCSRDQRIKGFQSLKEFDIRYMSCFSEWYGVVHGEFPRLRALHLCHAKKLRSLPQVPFLSLVTFELTGCLKLPTIPASPVLHELRVERCSGLTELPNLPSLQHLRVIDCPSLITLGRLPSLKALCLKGPIHSEILISLFSYALPLEYLAIISDTLECITVNPLHLPSLASLRLSCRNLQHFNGLSGLVSLKELRIWGCLKLHIFNSLPSQLETTATDIRNTPVREFDNFH